MTRFVGSVVILFLLVAGVGALAELAQECVPR